MAHGGLKGASVISTSLPKGGFDNRRNSLNPSANLYKGARQ